MVKHIYCECWLLWVQCFDSVKSPKMWNRSSYCRRQRKVLMYLISVQLILKNANVKRLKSLSMNVISMSKGCCCCCCSSGLFRQAAVDHDFLQSCWHHSCSQSLQAAVGNVLVKNPAHSSLSRGNMSVTAAIIFLFCAAPRVFDYSLQCVVSRRYWESSSVFRGERGPLELTVATGCVLQSRSRYVRHSTHLDLFWIYCNMLLVDESGLLCQTLNYFYLKMPSFRGNTRLLLRNDVWLWITWRRPPCWLDTGTAPAVADLRVQRRPVTSHDSLAFSEVRGQRRPAVV